MQVAVAVAPEVVLPAPAVLVAEVPVVWHLRELPVRQTPVVVAAVEQTTVAMVAPV
jgi:hypothetical protein